MSLNWDCSKCPGGSTPANDTEHGWRECLIWGSMCINMSRITEENVEEVLFRYRFMEQIGQSITTQPMTLEAIRRWIGLSTNADTLTRAKWISKVAKIVENDVSRNVSSEIKAETATV